MPDNSGAGPSNGYEEVAEEFRSRRSKTIGVKIVREWAESLPRGGAVLDLGCGDGTPISEVLVQAGLHLYAVDASPSLIGAFRARFPAAVAECASVMRSTFFDRRFDGVIAWGLLFLLRGDDQATLIAKVAGALVPGGRFTFTAPRQQCEWPDLITGWTSVSLGADEYRRILGDAGFGVVSEADDEGDNHYYFAVKR